jgi:predicted glutamine amidotransferase
MCGIFGFVSNEINNPGEFWQFAGRLAYHTERRGRQATGFAATVDGKFVTDKRDTGAGDFVKLQKSWRNLRYSSKIALIGHTRQATSGSPARNENNHPFTGPRYSVAHNGGVGAHDRVAAALGYRLRSECDSELLLHLLEDEQDIDRGVARVFTEVDRLSWMAVCVLEREKGVVHLFRDNNSPCVLVSIPRWNATVFCSTKEIIADALTDVLGTRARAYESAVMIFNDDIRPYTRFTINEDGELLEKDVKPLIKQQPSFDMRAINSAYAGRGVYSDLTDEYVAWAHDTEAYSGNATRYLPERTSSGGSTTTRTGQSGHNPKSFEDTAIFNRCQGCGQYIDALDMDSGLCEDCQGDDSDDNENATKRVREIIAAERKASSGLLSDDDEAVSDDDEENMEIRWKDAAVQESEEDSPLTSEEERRVLTTHHLASKLREPNPVFTDKDKQDFLLYSGMSWEAKREVWRDMTLRKAIQVSNGEWKAYLNYVKDLEDAEVKRMISSPPRGTQRREPIDGCE